MNVTPMIDVLLVLIIIFMVVMPEKNRGLNAKIPQPSPDDASAAAAPPRNDIVIHVGADGLIEINSQRVTLEGLADKLRPALRPGMPIFVQGIRGISYQEVAQVIDAARGAGATEVALLPVPAR